MNRFLRNFNPLVDYVESCGILTFIYCRVSVVVAFAVKSSDNSSLGD